MRNNKRKEVPIYQMIRTLQQIEENRKKSKVRK